MTRTPQTSEVQTNRVGFIGLGLLGLPMAMRLVHCGFNVAAWNREPDRTAQLQAAGGSSKANPSQVAEHCDIICLCVLDHAAVEAVVFGPEGIAKACSGRKRVVVDFSTLTPGQAVDIAHRAQAFNIEWLDAPVSGGPSAAQTGELTVMVGGTASALRVVKSIIDAVAKQTTHVGDVGSGQAMKAVNQALVGGSFVLLAEALALTHELGLDPDMVPVCLAGGMADSIALQRVWPKMAAEAFSPPTGRAAQLLKDLENIEAIRLDSSPELPVLETATAQYRQFVRSGHGNDETVSIARMYTQGPDSRIPLETSELTHQGSLK